MVCSSSCLAALIITCRCGRSVSTLLLVRIGLYYLPEYPWTYRLDISEKVSSKVSLQLVLLPIISCPPIILTAGF